MRFDEIDNKSKSVKTTDVKKMAEYYSAGKSFETIAKSMGFSPDTVRRHVSNLSNFADIKLAHDETKYWNSKTIMQLTNAYRYGMSIKEIATSMNRSEPNIKSTLSKLDNIEQLRKEHNKNSSSRFSVTGDQERDIIDSYISGMTPYEIAKRYGVGGLTIGRFLKSKSRYKDYVAKHRENSQRRINWKASDIANIVQRYSSGNTINAIAKHYKVSGDSIERVLRSQPNIEELRVANRKNSLTFINWTPELLNNIIDSYRRGSTLKSIADETGISLAVVYDRIKRQSNFDELQREHDSNSGTRKWTEEDIQRVIDMHNSGYSNGAIASKFGVSVTPIKRILKSM